MSSRHDSRHADDDGGGAYSPYDVFEDRDSQFQRNKIREDNERSKTRERERDRDRGKDRDRRHKDHPERSGRDRKDDDVRFRNRDHNRRHDYDRDKERHHRHRSHSASPDRSRESSRSRSKSKRTSGFDMAPPTATTLPGVVGQVPDAPQPVPGMFQNMFPFGTAQLGGLPLMPAQAMTQQATRHARRVYVGGLPPLANEQDLPKDQTTVKRHGYSNRTMDPPIKSFISFHDWLLPSSHYHHQAVAKPENLFTIMKFLESFEDLMSDWIESGRFIGMLCYAIGHAYAILQGGGCDNGVC
ncbi:hypothetical protein R6Q59_028116 [Mikania micrantha]